MMKHINSSLGFWCRHCETVQYASDYYYGETDDNYVYKLRCPNCGKFLTLKQKSVMATIREQINAGL